MKFKTKTESYSYAIYLLSELKNKYPPFVKSFNDAISLIQTCIEKHEQDPKIVGDIIQDTINQIKVEKTDSDSLINLKHDIEASPYDKVDIKERYLHPLPRRHESELPVLLLMEPTEAMMKSVRRISKILLKIIDDMESDGSIKWLLRILSVKSEAIGLGSLNNPKPKDLINILTENKNLPEILHIHFHFGRAIMRRRSLKHLPVRKPSGKLAEILATHWPTEDTENFFGKHGLGSVMTHTGRKWRSLISDTVLYTSKLFTSDRNRGRKGKLQLHTWYNQLGLMRPNQSELSNGFNKLRNPWVPDSKAQNADYNSQYVIDLVMNDAVYVAGPSGMTSVFIGVMENIGNLESIELKQNYLSAIVAYVVGGGFHSLHEVIGPAQFCMDLVPGYNVQVPKTGTLAEPPNYFVFYQQQMSIDPEFKGKYETAWKQYLNFFKKDYINYLYNNSLIQAVKDDDVKEVKSLIQQPEVNTEILSKSLENVANPDVNPIAKILELAILARQSPKQSSDRLFSGDTTSPKNDTSPAPNKSSQFKPE